MLERFMMSLAGMYLLKATRQCRTREMKKHPYSNVSVVLEQSPYCSKMYYLFTSNSLKLILACNGNMDGLVVDTTVRETLHFFWEL
jgi:hypothetical protein